MIKIRFNALQRVASTLLMLLTVTVSSAESPRKHEKPIAGQSIRTVEIASRLLRPWDMAFLSASQALVTEKEGGLKRVDLETGVSTDVSGLPHDLDNRNQTGLSDNAGLFAVVLDPDFARNHWVYLSYSASSMRQTGSTTKVIRAKLKDDHLTDIESLFIATPFSDDRYHYGGGLAIGKDRKLYITIGERLFDEKNQPEMPIAQDLSDRRGKIYRINTDGSVPDDNPRFSDASVDGLYALGIRAAQGLTVNRATGDIWFSEHGTRQGDEINRLTSGANYGWPIQTTGSYRSLDYQPPKLETRQFTDPIWSWETTVAPTGLTFYQGQEFPAWNGSLLVAGLSRGSLWLMSVEDRTIMKARELMTLNRFRLRNVRQAPDGKLYLLTDEANGRILRIVPE